MGTVKIYWRTSRQQWEEYPLGDGLTVENMLIISIKKIGKKLSRKWQASELKINNNNKEAYCFTLKIKFK